MFMSVKKLCVFLPLLLVSMAGNAQEEPAVVKYNNLLTNKASLGYNFMFFEETSPTYSFQTNRPWDFGVGIGIKNISFGFTFSIPFLYDQNYEKSQSFDVSFNHYNKHKNFSSGYIKYYNGFHSDADGDIDLRIFNIGISHEFVFNKNHSLRSVYNLDERQTISNGSFLFGGGLFFSSIRSDSSVLSNYSERQNTFYFGPNLGYSYTWVFQSNCFINALSTFGLNTLISNAGYSVGMQVLPRFSFGYHGKTWSANIFVNYSLLIGGYGTEFEYHLLSGNVGLSFIKRFL